MIKILIGVIKIFKGTKESNIAHYDNAKNMKGAKFIKIETFGMIISISIISSVILIICPFKDLDPS